MIFFVIEMMEHIEGDSCSLSKMNCREDLIPFSKTLASGKELTSLIELFKINN